MTDTLKIHVAIITGAMLFLTLAGPTWAAETESPTLDEMIGGAIGTSGFGSNYKLRIHSRPTEDAIGADRRLTAFSIDTATGQFRATIAATDANGVAREVTLAGKAERQASLPVLKRQFAVGDVIRAEDIGWLTLPANRASVGYVQTSAELIGKTVRRTKRPGDPLRTTDIRSPYAVKKGEIVTMRVRRGALSIDAAGRAMDNAPLGSPVRVQNIDSLQTVEGRAVGAGLVEVATRGAVLLADK